MPIEEYVKILKESVESVFRENLRRISIIIEENKPSRMWINYLFDYEEIYKNDFVDVIKVENKILNNISKEKTYEVQIVSGLFQGLYNLRENEIVVFERGKDELALRLEE